MKSPEAGMKVSRLPANTPGSESEDGTGGDRKYWRNQLEQIRPTNPRITVNHVFLEGDAPSEIVRFAADAGMDVIVLGTHGRTGVERPLMGSVAEKVMREAPCSVLVVKLPRASRPQPEVVRPVIRPGG